MEDTRPLSLKIVAWLFIIGGCFAVIEVITGLLRGHININFGVLGIFIGIGLLKLKNGWRVCALIFLLFTLILMPIIVVIMLSMSGNAQFNVFGQPAGEIPKGFVVLFALPVYLLTAWQFYVLTRPELRALFWAESRG